MATFNKGAPNYTFTDFSYNVNNPAGGNVASTVYTHANEANLILTIVHIQRYTRTNNGGGNIEIRTAAQINATATNAGTATGSVPCAFTQTLAQANAGSRLCGLSGNIIGVGGVDGSNASQMAIINAGDTLVVNTGSVNNVTFIGRLIKIYSA